MNQPLPPDTNPLHVELFSHEEIEQLKETYPAFTENIEDFALPLDKTCDEIALVSDNLDMDLIAPVPEEIRTKLILSIIFEQLGFDPNNAQRSHEEGETIFFKTNNNHILLSFDGEIWMLKYKSEDAGSPTPQK